MIVDPAFTHAVERLKLKAHRPDTASQSISPGLAQSRARLGLIGMALFFVILGAINLDLNGEEARLGLAAGERFGPIGQVFGYWAPDIWPARFLPSLALGRLEAFGRPSEAAVRWPAALAGIFAGWIVARGMLNALGLRSALIFGLCWFGSLALIDRSAVTGIDFIVGLATVCAINRMMSRGLDAISGVYAALAFLAGGWPPFIVIGLARIVLGKSVSRSSISFFLAPVAAVVGWSFWTIWVSSAEIWAAALTLPLTQKLAGSFVPRIAAMGLPWSPFAVLALSPSVRRGWKTSARPWLFGWLQVGIAVAIGGTLIPGLSASAGMVALLGLTVVTAACLEAAWARTLARWPQRTFFAIFAGVLGLWLTMMLYGFYIWNLAMPFYRPLGIIAGLIAIGVSILGWSALEQANSRRGFVSLIVIAIAIKLVHWDYYVPEWNYRYSEAPWARAISQWVPRRWVVYTFHDWDPGLAFFVKRPVRQLRSPNYLEYQSGPRSKFVLLLASEFENWPKSAPPITLVAKFLDQSAEERVLARTAGVLPPPLGPNPTTKLSLIRRSGPTSSKDSRIRR